MSVFCIAGRFVLYLRDSQGGVLGDDEPARVAGPPPSAVDLGRTLNRRLKQSGRVVVAAVCRLRGRAEAAGSRRSYLSSGLRGHQIGNPGRACPAQVRPGFSEPNSLRTRLQRRVSAAVAMSATDPHAGWKKPGRN